jgi:hypothetical protein
MYNILIALSWTYLTIYVIAFTRIPFFDLFPTFLSVGLVIHGSLADSN